MILGIASNYHNSNVMNQRMSSLIILQLLLETPSLFDGSQSSIVQVTVIGTVCQKPTRHLPIIVANAYLLAAPASIYC